ncbi:hypothetical protein LCGC14_0427830 [marine sediment metagenome]|uniref:Uncharacterized protein n=1 Tax=marine sediment metagenome TaxID=412755 RepID=A0A0F9VYK7_9ZZZZ
MLNHNERCVFIYSLTSPCSHLSGIYPLPMSTISRDVVISPGKVSDALDGLERALKVFYDRMTEEIWVVNMLKHQGRGEKIIKAAQKSLKEIHSHRLVHRFVNHYKDKGWAMACPMGYPTPCPSVSNQYQTQDQDQKEFKDTEVEGGPPLREKAAQKPDDTEPVRFWRDALDHGSAKVSPERITRVRVCRRIGFDNFEMMWAIVGCACSDWHMARKEYEGQKRRDQLALILRDATHVERFQTFIGKGVAKHVIDGWRATGKAKFPAAVEGKRDARD